MRNRVAIAMVLAGGAAVSGCHRGKPTSETFTWKGPVKADDWLRLRNVSGDFSIRQGTSDSAEIQLVIERSNQYAPTAQVKVLSLADGVIACVLYGDDGTCTAEEYKGGRTSSYNASRFMRGQTRVHGTVTLPRGVRLDARSTNGDIDVDAVTAAMQLTTVNGDIQVRGATQAIKVETTNGDVDLGLESVGGGLTVETTNGDVQVAVPPTLSAAVAMRTVNGELSLGLPGNVTTKTAKQIIATLGGGGSPINISTTNGSISLGQQGQH